MEQGDYISSMVGLNEITRYMRARKIFIVFVASIYLAYSIRSSCTYCTKVQERFLQKIWERWQGIMPIFEAVSLSVMSLV